MIKKTLKSIYFWIVLALILGTLFGLQNPPLARQMEPLAVSFVKLIKLFIGPIVFLTISAGVAQTGSLKKLSVTGLKAFIYFEVFSTLALIIGWLASSLMKPGAGMHIDVTTLDTAPLQQFIHHSEKQTTIQFLQHLIPNSIIEPFASGDILQILLLGILFGISLLAIGEKAAKPLVHSIEQLIQCLFKIIRIIMYIAPIGVFGSMAFTTATFGPKLFMPLLNLIATFYLAGLLFIFGVLGLVAKLAGFSIVRFLKYIATELLLILGTSSSEVALPALMRKLERLGASEETVGIVVPIGYSFNMDGTCIYITLAALFIAQALDIELTLAQEVALFITAMLSSKGTAGVAGGGFISLAATLAVVPGLPIEGMLLILGIDRFMGEGRALINFIGNGVAALTVSRWEKEMSGEQLNKALLPNH